MSAKQKPVVKAKNTQPKKASAKVDRPPSTFPIVGIGASAGGLEALEIFLASVFVQSPQTAKFDGMPKSAIDAGLADVIAAVIELPASISAFIHHAPLFTKSGLADQTNARRVLVGGMCTREQMK